MLRQKADQLSLPEAKYWVRMEFRHIGATMFASNGATAFLNYIWRTVFCRPLRTGWWAVALATPALAVLVTTPGARNAERRHLLSDWSARHVVFTGLTEESATALAEKEPRAWHSWMNHGGRRLNVGRPDPVSGWFRRRHGRQKQMERDWQMPVGVEVGRNVFPAKFGFDVNATPDCTSDFVVFPTENSGVPGASGTGTDASLVAFNNLYTGPGPSGICPTPGAPAAQPSVLFAYNTTTSTSGPAFAHLSPALSLDGKKIAFIESNDGFLNNYAAFHVLTWKAGEGTAWNSAAAPGDCSAGNSCMTTLVLSSTHSDSRSSPFVDYANDTAYVGDDGGQLHKITTVFGGTPTEVIGGGWPVQLNAAPGMVLSPVYDSVSGRIFVTENDGDLYVVNAATGAIINTVALTVLTPSDVILDSTDQTVFVFYPDLSERLSVSQFDTSGTLMKKVSVGTLGGSASVFTGTFDNNYFNDPSTGALYFAGSVNFVASLYSVGFTGTTMNSTFAGPLLLSTSSTTSTAMPLTEIFNPGFSTAPDRLFLGIEENCSSVSGNGCIESLGISGGFPSSILNSYELVSGGVNSLGAIIVDNVSISAQASSIYFEDSPQGAIKLTQSALQ
jgi:hypothetical protein